MVSGGVNTAQNVTCSPYEGRQETTKQGRRTGVPIIRNSPPFADVQLGVRWWGRMCGNPETSVDGDMELPGG